MQEDSMRMMTDWGDQSKYFKRQLWGSIVLANLFVFLNMVLQVRPYCNSSLLSIPRFPPDRRLRTCG